MLPKVKQSPNVACLELMTAQAVWSPWCAAQAQCSSYTGKKPSLLSKLPSNEAALCVWSNHSLEAFSWALRTRHALLPDCSSEGKPGGLLHLEDSSTCNCSCPSTH